LVDVASAVHHFDSLSVEAMIRTMGEIVPSLEFGGTLDRLLVVTTHHQLLPCDFVPIHGVLLLVATPTTIDIVVVVVAALIEQGTGVPARRLLSLESFVATCPVLIVQYSRRHDW
jgi:hypothetical protein